MTTIKICTALEFITALEEGLNNRGISVSLCGENEIEFATHSPQGQEFSEHIEVPLGDGFELEKALVIIEEELSEAHECFCPGENFVLWWGKNNGEPKDPQELLNSGLWYEDELRYLSENIRSIIFNGV